MKWIIVVNSIRNADFVIPDAQLVSARDYLTKHEYYERKRLKVINLCKSYKYQSIGYYVSLLAEARGHLALPSVSTMMDFKSPSVLRAMASDLDKQIQHSLKALQGTKFTLSIYFGCNLAARYDRLCRLLVNMFPAPLLRAQFSKSDGYWSLDNISPIATTAIPENHREFALGASVEFLKRRRVFSTGKSKTYRYDIAMLVDPDETTAPSNEQALKRFEKAGEKLGVLVTRIRKEDYSELTEYDALLIRTTTQINNFTYRFARKAEAERMPAMDDSLSILRCTNKVYLHELLEKNGVALPRSIIVQKESLGKLLDTMDLPIILKEPDSSFSQGVVKVKTPDECFEAANRMFEKSELLIAQEFLPTDFDWRIGMLDGLPLFACRYYMASGHWQIYNHTAKKASGKEGNANCVSIDDVPAVILDAAIRSSNLIGKGLYGVDVKQSGDKAYVIEVNDNPSIDGGVEDFLLGEEIYLKIIKSLINRIEQRSH